MSSFYKMDPAAWDFGTANLTLEQEAAYLRIVNAIHKHDAPVPNIDRVLAGLFRCSTRKARSLVAALLDAKKITVENGQIWNFRARSELVQRGFASVSASERGANGGRTRAENAAKPLERNKSPQANASSRIEENRIEYKDSARCALDCVLGDELSGQWLAHRKALKSAMTEHAITLFAKKLGSMESPKDAVETAIQNGWKTVYPPKPGDQQQKPKPGGQFAGAFGFIPERG